MRRWTSPSRLPRAANLPISDLKVIVNRGGGAATAAGDKLPQQLHDAFAAAGQPIDLALVEGDSLADTIEGAMGEPRIVIAGGDGTVACAAQALADSEAELAVLPLGTLNHLARDVGVPAKLEDAAALAVSGKAIRIDVAEVNGKVFVNNASIGLYPLMVRERDEVRERRGWPKWLSTIPAAYTALERLPHHRLRVDLGQGERSIVTPLLFVGNNAYSLDRGSVGTRETLQDGLLSVYAVRHRSRRSLIWFALRALAGRAERKLDFIALGECATLKVTSPSGSIELALDGEVQRLDSPLDFRIRPGALKVVAP